MADRFEQAGAAFVALLRLMEKLRAPDGCPWDQAQTFDTIKPYTLEETYEVLDAIDRRDWKDLQNELGDLLLQPVFLAEIARSEQLFDIADSLQAINDKLIRRHPHIFGDAQASTPEEVKVRWDEIKQSERASEGHAVPPSVLLDVLRNQPALVEAQKLSVKAAGLGFEWPTVAGVLEKLTEEANELAAAGQTGTPEEVEHELGDLLFTVVNLARWMKVDSEQALRKANERFRRRFGYIERTLSLTKGGDHSLGQMEERWAEAKQLERKGEL